MPSKPTSALSDFVRISETIYIYDPKSQDATKKSLNRDPRTIVLVAWMGASAGAIAKYVNEYKAIFPTSRIIVIKTEMVEMFMHSDSRQKMKLAPVVSALQADQSEQVMIVTFSNAGSHKTSKLVEAYKEMTGSILPLHALVLDSAPGKTTFKENVSALQLGIPKSLYYPGTVAIYGFLVVMFAYFRILKIDSFLERAGKLLNNPQLMDIKAHRLYIYSKQDKIIRWQDVLEHASEAKERGCKVKTEMFENGSHAAHVRVDPDRYWEAVEKNWASGRQSKL